MRGWYQFKLIFSDGDVTRLWTKSNYQFIRNDLISLVRRLPVTNFHILNYFEPNKKDFIRLRVEMDISLLDRLRDELEAMKRSGKISRYEYETYSSREDAEERIESTRKELEKMTGGKVDRNWRISGLHNNRLIIASDDDYSRKVRDFQTFLDEILGKFTVAFTEKIERRPDDRWLLSLFVHLILNSICYDDIEEKQIRLC